MGEGIADDDEVMMQQTEFNLYKFILNVTEIS